MKVPDKCLICGAPWSGGHETPFNTMKENLRIFYNCGASMVFNRTAIGICYILIKNCLSEEITWNSDVNIKGSDD